MNAYQTVRWLNINDAEIPETLGGEGCIRVTLGQSHARQKRNNVNVCCSVYVYSSGGGRRTEADVSRYEQNNGKKETHTTVVVLL